MAASQPEKLGGICGYCKSRCAERYRRAAKEPSIPERHHSCKRLTKPPKVQMPRKRSARNRLHKRCLTPSTLQLPRTLFILQYEAYPYNTKPGDILGVFSNIEAVTLAAVSHGAYAFSREGLLDGSEYLNPTGRIKILSLEVHRLGVEAALPGGKRSSNREGRRRSSARDANQAEDSSANGSRETVYVAMHRGPTSTSCIGIFTKKTRAWGACLKNQAMHAYSNTLRDESRIVDENGMPSVRARLVGSGLHQWFVHAFHVDRVDR